MASSYTDAVDETTQKTVNKELLLTAITHYENTDDIFIKEFAVFKGCKADDNFATVVLSVVANIQRAGEEITKQLILKIPTANEIFKEKADNQRRLFLKESSFYCDIIPAMRELQVERGLHQFGPSVPLHLYSTVDETGGVIVLEDLRPEGYRTSDILLNYDHCKLVMKELAKFHALGFAIKKGNPRNLLKFKSVLEENLWNRPFPEIFTQSFNFSLNLVESSTSDEKIFAAVETLRSKNLEDLVTKQIQPIEPYAVLCHGDSWSRNMLFRYEKVDGTESPVDVKLIDYQACRYALPTTDLSYFFFTSTTREMRKSKLQELLVIYHDNFIKCLKLLNIDLPEYSFNTLERLYKQTALCGLLTVYTLGPLGVMRRHKAKSHHEQQSSKEDKNELEISTFLEALENKAEFLNKIEDMVEMGLP